MATSHILRIALKDTDGFVLGQVSSRGQNPLDAKLVFTEGVDVYHVSLQQDRVLDLLDGNACTPDEWDQILKSVLLGGEPVKDVEAVATVDPGVKHGESITIHFRRRVSGINQRLGAITLRYSKHEEIQLFDWCIAAVGDRDSAQKNVTSSGTQVEDLEAKVAGLKSLLAELEEVKKAEDADLLARFGALLNEKKAKIAEQKRILKSANLDPDEVSEPEAANRSPSSPQRRGPRSSKMKASTSVSAKGRGAAKAKAASSRATRTSKRKADEPPEEDADVEMQDVNEENDGTTEDEDESGDAADRRTPETASDDDGDGLRDAEDESVPDVPVPVTSKRTTRAAAAAKSKDIAPVTATRSTKASQPPEVAQEDIETESGDEL